MSRSFNFAKFPLFAEPELKGSTEGLDLPKFSTLENLGTPAYLDELDRLQTPLNGSTESVGMCNSIKDKQTGTLPISISRIDANTYICTILSPLIPANVIAQLFANMDALPKDSVFVLRVATILNEDTWLSLCSALSACKGRTVFKMDFVYNIASLLVIAVVDAIEVGPFSYLVLDAPTDRMAGGTPGDVEFMVENYKRIQQQVIDYAVRAQLFTADELAAVYEERAVYGLFGAKLLERIGKRVKVT